MQKKIPSKVYEVELPLYAQFEVNLSKSKKHKYGFLVETEFFSKLDNKGLIFQEFRLFLNLLTLCARERSVKIFFDSKYYKIPGYNGKLYLNYLEKLLNSLCLKNLIFYHENITIPSINHQDSINKPSINHQITINSSVEPQGFDPSLRKDKRRKENTIVLECNSNTDQKTINTKQQDLEDFLYKENSSLQRKPTSPVTSCEDTTNSSLLEMGTSSQTKNPLLCNSTKDLESFSTLQSQPFPLFSEACDESTHFYLDLKHNSDSSHPRKDKVSFRGELESESAGNMNTVFNAEQNKQAKRRRAKKRISPNPPNPINAKIWECYSEHFEQKYKIKPARGVVVNSQIKKLAQTINPEWDFAELIRKFFESTKKFYTENQHSFGIFYNQIEILQNESEIKKASQKTKTNKLNLNSINEIRGQMGESELSEEEFKKLYET